MAQFDEDTFELGDTPVADSQTEVSEEVVSEETQEVEAPVADTQEVETQETDTPEPDPDNNAVRAAYQQSEADKYKNIAQEQGRRIDNLVALLGKQNQPEAVVNQPPAEPEGDDPNDWVMYNAKMAKYNADEIKSLKQGAQADKDALKKQKDEASMRDYTIGRMTEVTKSPEKSEKILGFFANTQNFAQPDIYNVMYDAAMGYLNKKPSNGSPENPLTPPPPTGGGKAVEDKKTPDDEFNDSLGEENRYRL